MSNCDKRISPSQKTRPAAAPLSRRALFPTIFLSAAAVGAALSLGSDMAEAQSKTSKKVAKYQDHPNSGAHCSECRYFLPPHSCVLVEGDISPNGWCSFFAKKSA
jgi:hypothetical protein